MTQTLARPADFFDRQYGMNTASLQRVLDRTLSPQIDYADLYFQYEVSDAVSLEEGEVKQGSKQINQGVGIRALAGEKTGYAFSDEITVPSLEAAARTAREIAQTRSRSTSVAVQGALAPAHDLYPVQVAGTDVPVQRKLDLLQQIDTFCRAYDPRITKVQTSFSSVHKLVLIATSEGKVVGDVQPLLRLNVACIAEAGGNRQNGSAGGGGRISFETFVKGEQYLDLAREAARRAVLNLDAVDAPAGTMDVVLGPGWPGILLHEAIGHGLEGDFNRKGTSAFSGRIGERIASEACTVVDDGTHGRGAADRSTWTTRARRRARNVLIEDGILCGYLQDRLNARLMGVEPTGNGRRAELRAPADAAHDQHLHAQRRIDARGNHRLGGVGTLRRVVRRRTGGYHQRQVRLFGQRSLPDRRRQGDAAGEGRQPDRQRTGRPDAHQQGRQRLCARYRRRYLRQERSGGAGRRRHADDSHERDHGRRHALGAGIDDSGRERQG